MKCERHIYYQDKLSDHLDRMISHLLVGDIRCYAESEERIIMEILSEYQNELKECE